MKYIIKESKLNNIIFKYLDMKYGALEQKKGRYSDIVFTFPGEEYGLLGWEKSGDLYVCYELRYEISNLFGLENVNSLRVIGKWVEDKYNLKVTNTYSQLNNMQYLVEGIYKVNSKDRMKSIITESKLNNIIFKYLDMKYGALEQKKGKYVDIVFHFPGEEYGKLGLEKPETLYVYDVLMNEISNYFGLESVDSLRVIGKWVKDRYNLKVINTHDYWQIA